MKMWHKIYLAVLLISILFANAGIYLVFQLTYWKNIETEQIRGEVDYVILRRSVQINMQALENQGRLTESAATDLMKICEGDYQQQGLRVKLWKNSTQLYPEDGEEKKMSLSSRQAFISIRGKRQEKKLTAVSELDNLKDSYTLYIEYPLRELNNTWGRLHHIYLAISLGISVVLALSLSIMLRFLLAPLNHLAAGVSNIQSGNYTNRISVHGNDELACLGKNINAMAETIAFSMNALREDNRKKEQLADNLAHEMKSPLTSIYGFAEYLSKTDAGPEEIRECCFFIMEESRRMKDMCYALMELSGLRHSNIPFETFAAGPFWEELETTARKLLSRQPGNLPVRMMWQNQIPSDIKICGNRKLMEILVLNLVSNAALACLQKDAVHSAAKDPSEPDITVTLSSTDETERSILIKVSDHGIGIPEDKLPHLTEPFYRVDESRSRDSGGNGLGLALCRQIAERHEGTISFCSRTGKGTDVAVLFWIKK